MRGDEHMGGRSTWDEMSILEGGAHGRKHMRGAHGWRNTWENTWTGGTDGRGHIGEMNTW